MRRKDSNRVGSQKNIYKFSHLLNQAKLFSFIYTRRSSIERNSIQTGHKAGKKKEKKSHSKPHQ